jgi:outer membrane murein-binding lipoprotein Lpp
MTFQGIVVKFDFVSPRKISQILPVFKYNSSVSTQSHDILANYVASSVQWHKCYGTLRPRGNTKKPKTPDEMISRMQLKDSDYSDDGSDVTFSDRSLRCHRKPEPKQEKHQMTSRQDSASAKRLKNELFEYVDFT